MKGKLRKRIYAAFAFLAMFLCMLPGINAAAEDTVTRAGWLHNLTEAFGMSVGEAAPDNYFSDITADSPYYQDIMVAVEFGLLDVEAGEAVHPEEAVTREFAAHTLNFCLGFQLEDENYTFNDAGVCSYPKDAQIAVNRGWFTLVNGKFAPNTNITAAEAAAMLADAGNVLASVQIGQSQNSDYVFADDVVEIPAGTEISVDENDVVTIVNCPKNIRQGDTFVVWPSEMPLLYLADSVTVSGNVTRITTAEADAERAVLAMDVQGTTNVDLASFEESEGVTATYIRTESDVQRAQSMYGIRLDKNSVIAEKEIELGDGMKAKIACNLSNLKLETKIKNSRTVFILR